MTRIFSYVIKHDSGFAPNPFGGLLTLATCKPQIRRTAQKDDCLVGTGSAKTVGNDKLVYAAEIAEVVPLEEYGSSAKYTIKRPSTDGEWWQEQGDNIYHKVGGRWEQRPNAHHVGHEMKIHDVSGKNVLICERFWYFGAAALTIPSEYRELVKKGPGYKRIEDELLVRGFLRWMDRFKEGCRGTPEMSPRPADTCATGSSRVGC